MKNKRIKTGHLCKHSTAQSAPEPSRNTLRYLDWSTWMVRPNLCCAFEVGMPMDFQCKSGIAQGHSRNRIPPRTQFRPGPLMAVTGDVSVAPIRQCDLWTGVDLPEHIRDHEFPLLTMEKEGLKWSSLNCTVKKVAGVNRLLSPSILVFIVYSVDWFHAGVPNSVRCFWRWNVTASIQSNDYKSFWFRKLWFS